MTFLLPPDIKGLRHAGNIFSRYFFQKLHQRYLAGSETLTTYAKKKHSPWAVLRKRWTEKFRKMQSKNSVLDSPFNEIAGLQPATSLKRTSTEIFFFIFYKNFQKQLYYGTPPDDCFWSKHVQSIDYEDVVLRDGHLYFFKRVAIIDWHGYKFLFFS